MSEDITLERLKRLKESEDKVEFKEAKRNFPFAGGQHTDQIERRKCFLGYVVALANERGGTLVLGMTDPYPHKVVGTNFGEGELGQLEDEVYKRIHIRIDLKELYEDSMRVLVVTVPSRPVGKLIKFEGVPLMRIGESLRNMSDEEMFKILSETEPDFSAKICDGLSITDLDKSAIGILKDKYALKQKNSGFRTLSDEQILSDLDLSRDNKLTYAALILLGTQTAIRKYLPQARIIIEFRDSETSIPHDWRVEVDDALFIGIEKIWSEIRNSNASIRSGPYIYSVPFFNEEVIRESLLNAIAHRDYSLTSETVIKQFPSKITITNPGGFPKGVTLENILTINSTPRSRLLSEILLKTGLVERSGQGVDKIFSLTLSEGKPTPDYSESDLFQVSLTLDGKISNPAFYIFIFNTQKERNEDNKLGVHDIITLAKIRDGHQADLNPVVVGKLVNERLIRSTHSRLVLGDFYQKLVRDEQSPSIGTYLLEEVKIIVEVAEKSKKVKMGVFVKSFNKALNREQVKYLVDKLVEDAILMKEGKGSGTTYSLNERITISEDKMSKVVDMLNEKYKDQ
ncbi:ATP-binding protein [Persicitalea jodogahamensis]|uniref:ATP-binding protein n=1 Tax=Persicitalea jodogahamensis TaxID=402147 RepID=UPI001E5B97CE|nr:ATP-binding protein [Persicitalea jodogahamensis]